MKVQKNISNLDIKQQIKVTTLNLTDIIANSNKFYNIEVLETSSNEFVIYTNYGRTGSSVAKEYRICSSLSEAEKEADKIVKSKIKKGYVEVKLIKTDVGSEVGKQKINNSIEANELTKAFGESVLKVAESKLNSEVQRVVKTWFSATNDFIEVNLDTKKCPLGQLSVQQILKGKDILNEARVILHNSKSIDELNKLTNSYYSNIPHVLGHKISQDLLRFDSDDKISKALDTLDVFSDAKDLGDKIKSNSIDQKYETLNADIQLVDKASDVYKWIERFFFETRASNHGSLGRLKIHNIFKLARNNEHNNFLKNAERIAKECGKFSPAKLHGDLMNNRPDLDKDMDALYKKANVLLMCHGTRSFCMSSIIRSGLLIRPTLPGVIISGALFGNGCYWGFSTKSLNYVDIMGSVWAGANSNKKGFLFLADVACGNQKLATSSYQFTKENIKPNHSVYARGGTCGLINDEMMTYEPTGENQQHFLKYVLEVESQA